MLEVARMQLKTMSYTINKGILGNQEDQVYQIKPILIEKETEAQEQSKKVQRLKEKREQERIEK